MKIRNGFVSNSSSSSFILLLDKIPQSVEELKEMFFDDKEYLSPILDTNLASEIMFRSINFAPTEEELIDEVYSLQSNLICDFEKIDQISIDEFQKHKNYFLQTYKEEYDKRKEYDKNLNIEKFILFKLKMRNLFKEEKLAKKESIKVLKKLKKLKKRICLVEYSDEGGDIYAELEHGSAFDNVDHIRISKH